MPYQQIDKEQYPQLYKNKRQRVVLSAIGTGREQGAHLRDIHRATGFGERTVRKVIEDIRRTGVVVCNCLPVRVWAKPQRRLCRCHPGAFLRGGHRNFCGLPILPKSAGLQQAESGAGCRRAPAEPLAAQHRIKRHRK